MTGCAKFGLPDMGGLRRQETLGTGMHYPLAAHIDCIGTKDGTALSVSRGSNQVSAVETLRLTQIVRLDLMADRACHTVHGQMCCGRIFLGRFLNREKLRRLASSNSHGVPHRHVADRTSILDGGNRRRVVYGLPPHAGPPVGIACRHRHDRCSPLESDRDVLTGWRLQVAVAGDAAFALDEHVLRWIGGCCTRRSYGIRGAAWGRRSQDENEKQDARSPHRSAHVVFAL